MFLQQIMSDALDEHDEKVSIDGKNISLWFCSEIAALVEEEQIIETSLEVSTKPAQNIKRRQVLTRPN